MRILLLIIIVCTAISCTQNTEKQPNVLLVMTDDQGWGDLSFHGNDSIFTPNIDKLAAQSCRFDRFYVSPVCAPTRASLLTGKYHLRTGTSWVTHRKEVMRSKETTIAEVFRDNGYATGCFGKWHNGEQYPNDPNGQGFEEFVGFSAGHWNNYFDTKLIHNQEEINTKGYISDVLTDSAIDFMQKNKDKPFLCYVPYNAPHSPFQVPDKYFDKYKKMGLNDKNACVYGMVENIDDNVGRLLQALDNLEITDNTIVIFLTDNGPNGNRYNGGMRGRKGQVHEGGVRVPFFVSWKGHLPENHLIKPLSAHIDVLPTLAELCGISLPSNLNLDGKSLAPLLKNKNAEWESRPIFTIHSEGEMRMKPAAVRTDDYRMVIDYGGTPHLYNMKNDPAEKSDLAKTQPQLLDSLMNVMKDWFTDVTKEGISIPPIPVGYADAKTTFLPAPEATLTGNITFEGDRGWANDYIINWKKDDAATWKVDAHQAGNYDLQMLYNSNDDFNGAVFEVKIGNKTYETTVNEAFNDSFENSIDRVKRGEVYEKNWGRLNVGEVDLSKGENDITVQLKIASAGGTFELRGLKLEMI